MKHNLLTMAPENCVGVRPPFSRQEGGRLRRIRRGFTLIELLVVMAIIAIMLGITVPAISAIITSYNLSTATDQVVSELNLARQDALSLNANVYVVFFQYKGSTPFEGSAGRFRAMQLFQAINVPEDSTGNPVPGTSLPSTYITTGNTNIYLSALTKPIILGGTTVIADQQSTLIQPTYEANLTQLVGATYSQFGGGTIQTEVFCFTPNGTNLNAVGSTTNPSENGFPFLLICDLKTLSNAGATALPANYALVEINPLNGVARVFRP